MCQAFWPSIAVTDCMLDSAAKDPVAGNAKLTPVLGFAKHAAAQWLSRQRASAAQKIKVGAAKVRPTVDAAREQMQESTSRPPAKDTSSLAGMGGGMGGGDWGTREGGGAHTKGKSIGGDLGDGGTTPDADTELMALRNMQSDTLATITESFIHPHGCFRQRWDVASIVFIFYGALIIPFQVSFGMDGPVGIFVVDRFIDVFFTCDILVNFRTADIVNGAVAFESRTTALRYLRSWFLVDFVAAFPWWALGTARGGSDGASSSSASSLAQMSRVLQLARLLRLLRMFRLTRILVRLEYSLTIRAGVSSIMRFMATVVISSHWFSCIFFVINNAAVSNEWLAAAGVDADAVTVSDQYIAAFYWAIMTMTTVGFGDVVPVSTGGRFFAIFVMIFGAGVFAFGVTNVVRIVGSLNETESLFREKMDRINSYMHARRLPPDLRAEIREYVMRCERSTEHDLGAEPEILGQLSTLLRAKVAMAVNDQFLQRMPFFAGLEPTFVMQLALSMRTMVFMPSEEVVKEGDSGDDMFFIYCGAVEVLSKGKQLVVLGRDQYFGETALLNHGSRRSATIRTLDYCELRAVGFGDFAQALAEFPRTQDLILQMARMHNRVSGASSSGKIKMRKFSDATAYTRKPLVEAASTSTLVDLIRDMQSRRRAEEESRTAASSQRRFCDFGVLRSRSRGSSIGSSGSRSTGFRHTSLDDAELIVHEEPGPEGGDEDGRGEEEERALNAGEARTVWKGLDGSPAQ